MMRPKLPSVIEQQLPSDIVDYIYKFVPHTRIKKTQHSPSLQKELQRIQTISLKGKSAMYMKDFNDFCLD